MGWYPRPQTSSSHLGCRASWDSPRFDGPAECWAVVVGQE
jgi:hypothetical protein